MPTLAIVGAGPGMGLAIVSVRVSAVQPACSHSQPTYSRKISQTQAQRTSLNND